MACTSRVDRHMSLDFGLQDSMVCQKQKNRWLFHIEDVSVTGRSISGIPALPPLKSNRPKFSFREQQVQHLVQSIYYPIKADWGTINLTLYDLGIGGNPVLDWIKTMYRPEGKTTSPEWQPMLLASRGGNVIRALKKNGFLCLYDGCGEIIESWTYENCYPKSVNWGDLDMATGDVVVVEIELRYDRAYIGIGGSNVSGQASGEGSNTSDDGEIYNRSLGEEDMELRSGETAGRDFSSTITTGITTGREQLPGGSATSISVGDLKFTLPIGHKGPPTLQQIALATKLAAL